MVEQVENHSFDRKMASGGALNCNRIDTISVGIVLALVSETATDRRSEPAFLCSRSLQWTFAPILVGFLQLGPIAMNSLALVPAAPAAVTAGIRAIVFLVSYDRVYVFKNSRLPSVLFPVGERSYSIYLAHNLAMFATTEMFSALLRPAQGSAQCGLRR
jgi:peptidoglycan/LPS O-acetylase OafA/YrhL